MQTRQRFVSPWLVLAPLLMASSPPPMLTDAPELTLEGDAAAGHVRASWENLGSAVIYELQRAPSSRFEHPEVLYRGPHNASVLSGLNDGRFYLRVRAVAGTQLGPWSKAEVFAVQHHSLTMAMGFLAAGAIVFAATLGFLVYFVTRGSDD